MKLILERYPNERATPGELFVDGSHECWTLERSLGDQEHPAILYGVYRVTLRPTYNKRLWTPRDDLVLPHIEDVPGRAGIEIHAGNTVKDTEGCVIVGYERSPIPNELMESRRALVTLMEKMLSFEAIIEPCTIEIAEHREFA